MMDARRNEHASTDTPTVTPNDVLVSVRDLEIEVRSRLGTGHAVTGVSFDVHRGETLGLVGESGSGKSLTASAILQLLPQPIGRIVGGSIWFEGENLVEKTPEEMRKVRGRKISMVLQDPLSALNPAYTIRTQLEEPLKLHTALGRGDRLKRVVQLLAQLHIPRPEERMNAYPHQFSGGMRQRVVGAIAIGAEPQLLIADEPTTALDVTVQAAYLELLKELKARKKMSMLFITHDFSVVRSVSDRIAVMYGGRIAEVAPTKTMFERPAHPYTRALIDAVPDIRKPTESLVTIGGSPPSIYKQPTGCRFAPRCWLYKQLGEPDKCRTQVPQLEPSGEVDSQAACHFTSEALRRKPEPIGSAA